MKYVNTTESMTVTSSRYQSKPSVDLDGMLACKLISPARVIEWILVDGLKKNYYWIPKKIAEETD